MSRLLRVDPGIVSLPMLTREIKEFKPYKFPVVMTLSSGTRTRLWVSGSFSEKILLPIWLCTREVEGYDLHFQFWNVSQTIDSWALQAYQPMVKMLRLLENTMHFRNVPKVYVYEPHNFFFLNRPTLVCVRSTVG